MESIQYARYIYLGPFYKCPTAFRCSWPSKQAPHRCRWRWHNAANFTCSWIPVKHNWSPVANIKRVTIRAMPSPHLHAYSVAQTTKLVVTSLWRRRIYYGFLQG